MICNHKVCTRFKTSITDVPVSSLSLRQPFHRLMACDRFVDLHRQSRWQILLYLHHPFHRALASCWMRPPSTKQKQKHFLPYCASSPIFAPYPPRTNDEPVPSIFCFSAWLFSAPCMFFAAPLASPELELSDFGSCSRGYSGLLFWL